MQQRMLSALFILSAFGTGCVNQATLEEVQPPLVRTCVAESEGSDKFMLRGSVAPKGRLRLGFKQPGVIGSVYVREGDNVRAGQVLALLDDVDAQSQLRTSKANLDRARRDADRTTRLVAEGALPANQRDDARNQLETCEAQWRQANDGLNRTRLVTPVSGAVFQRLAEPGEVLAAGNPVLVVDTTERLVVKAGLAERELRQLKIDQEVTLTPDDGSAALTGRVTSLGPAPNPTDGQYALEVTPGKGALRSGTLVAIGFKNGLSKPGVRVPFSALVHRQDQDFMFVIAKTSTGWQVKARAVILEKSDGTGAVLRSGVARGEQIVAEGAFFLQDGQAVRCLE